MEPENSLPYSQAPAEKRLVHLNVILKIKVYTLCHYVRRKNSKLFFEKGFYFYLFKVTCACFYQGMLCVSGWQSCVVCGDVISADLDFEPAYPVWREMYYMWPIWQMLKEFSRTIFG